MEDGQAQHSSEEARQPAKERARDDKEAISVESRGFLIDDYKLKVGYLSDHFGRMWTRFNFFVTI